MLTQICSATEIIFCHFRPFFALSPHYWPWKLKFGKDVKNTWRYYPFTHVYHKSRSYDGRFLRLPFDPPKKPKNQNFEKIKKRLGMLSFNTCVPQMMIIWSMVPEISSTKDRIFCHLGLFFALLPPIQPRKSKFWKNEKNS